MQRLTQTSKANLFFHVCGFGGRGRTYRFSKFRQLVEDRYTFEPLFVVNCRVSADNFSIFNIIGNTALRGGDDTIADVAVSGDANLPSEDDIFPDFSRSG